MRIPRIYQPGPLSSGSRVALNDDSFAHLIRVLRLTDGDAVILFNGEGSEYSGQLVNVGKKQAEVELDNEQTPAVESPLRIHVGQAISRGERMDYAVQKASEMGLAQLTPLFTERCEVRLNQERQEKRQRHWQQVAVSACEQSLRTRIPIIAEPEPLQQWLDNVDAELKLVLHHHTAAPLGSFERPTSVALLIGPEGGLTETEVQQALDAGFQPVAFGPRVMRTETAPVAASAILQYLWGDLG